jgi:hypothetical protein
VEVAEALRRKARAQRSSVSKFLAELVSREVGTGWPEGFETVLGGWQGASPVRPDPLTLEDRHGLDARP